MADIINAKHRKHNDEHHAGYTAVIVKQYLDFFISEGAATILLA